MCSSNMGSWYLQGKNDWSVFYLLMRIDGTDIYLAVATPNLQIFIGAKADSLTANRKAFGESKIGGSRCSSDWLASCLPLGMEKDTITAILISQPTLVRSRPKGARSRLVERDLQEASSSPDRPLLPGFLAVHNSRDLISRAIGS